MGYYDSTTVEKLLDAAGRILALVVVAAAATVGGCWGYDVAESKSRLQAYNDCLKNTSRLGIADITLLCDKIKERL